MSQRLNVAALFSQHMVFRLRSITMGAAMSRLRCDAGLDNRCRDNDGEIRHKRSDTLVRTLRETYPDFAQGYRGDTKLGTVLKNEDAVTLSELLKRR
jgi:hypothetical protein